MKHGIGLLALVLAAASCSDGPSAPQASAVAVERTTVDGQSAPAGTAVPVAPAVQVRRGADPLEAVAVEFVVTDGGGTVANALAFTNAEGIASAGEWRLGSEPGANELEARVEGAQPIRFSATGTGSVEPPDPPSAFEIAVRWVGSATPRQHSAVSAAVARWRTVVVGDLSDIPMVVPAGTCFPTQPALSETVDDLLIFVEFVDIDGPGKVLGSAGPCYVRSENTLPVVGHLKLDREDLEMMESVGNLEDVVLHEIGHVMGIGTLWSSLGLLTGRGGDDPVFTGTSAVAAYHELGGVASTVPVENVGEAGSRDGHWRETEFGDELMTPFIGRYPNPLSTLTAASLADLGYGATSSGAARYTLGGTRGSVSEAIDLRGRERIHGPKFKVDRRGRHERLDELPEGAAAKGLRG